MSGSADGVPLSLSSRSCRHRPARRSRARGVSLALRSRRPILAVHPGRDESELPARRAGSGRERAGDVQVDLSGLLRGTMAAYSLRGVSRTWPRRPALRTRRTSQIALPKSANDRGLRDQPATSKAFAMPRRSPWPATACSATARRSNWPRRPASVSGFTATLTVAV